MYDAENREDVHGGQNNLKKQPIMTATLQI